MEAQLLVPLASLYLMQASAHSQMHHGPILLLPLPSAHTAHSLLPVVVAVVAVVVVAVVVVAAVAAVVSGLLTSPSWTANQYVFNSYPYHTSI